MRRMENANNDDKATRISGNSSRLDNAHDFSEVYDVVKDTVKQYLRKYRVGMMLYLDDLPLQVGAYHPVGTNSIIMNRALLNLVESATTSRQTVNAFVYSILLHEYLHALGYLPEETVRPMVYEVSEASFGEEHIATRLAKAGPWSVLQGVPLDRIEAPKRVMEIVKNFEKTNQSYIS
jgi:hypothetical protein